MPPGVNTSMINLPVAGAENAGLDIAGSGSTTAISASMAPGSVAEGVEVEDGRGDLTVFFAIGMIINVLMVTAFLVWAVGQWRKKK